MNMQKLTQKSIEAVNAAQKTAKEYGNTEIGQEHLLYALLDDADGLICQLLEKDGKDVEKIKTDVINRIEKMPRASGNGGQYLTSDLNDAFDDAQSQADNMKDDYVSVEHLFLGLIDKANSFVKDTFRTYGISKDGFLKALVAVRGNQRVTGDNPESTYDVLNKYGVDLV